MPDLGIGELRLLLAAGVFLAATHAYRKLSPYFAMTWFGAGLVFGWLWAEPPRGPEVVLLPVLVVYAAAAATKGLVERGRLAGNHLVHVLVTGLLSAAVALPYEALARELGLPVPRPAGRVLLGVSPGWLGGVTLDVALLWAIVGTVFYGAYKLLDHVGLGRPLQTVLLFAATPLMVTAAERLHRLV